MDDMAKRGVPTPAYVQGSASRPLTIKTKEELTTEIKSALSSMAQAFRDSVKQAMHCGDLLKQAKERVGHGNFEPWLKDNFNLSYRTANRYMKLADSRNVIENKLAIVADLKLADAYALIGQGNKGSKRERGEDDNRVVPLKADPARLTDELVRALKALKKDDEIRARKSVSTLIQRLKDADLIEAEAA